MHLRIFAAISICVSLAACSASDREANPLTSNSAQDAKVRAKSAQVHTVLMTLTGNQISNAERDISSVKVKEEPGDGDSIAMGSSN